MESDKERFERISDVRQKAKVVNYSALYGIGAAKLARTTGMSQREAKELIDTFWEVNWAVREVAKESTKKVLPNGEIWVYNTVSGFWYNLRYEKDAWSTINQSTGVYVFDKWLAICKKLGLQVTMQYHDEHLSVLNPGDEQQHENKIREAIDILNKDIKLNVPIDADSKFGFTYASVH